jgi:TPR repeat protein
MLGCSQLGLMLLLSEGAARDTDRAATLLDRACSHGDARGCGSLAALYSEQHKDGARIAALFQKACDAGDPISCFRLGVRHERGDGVSKDAGGRFQAGLPASEATRPRLETARREIVLRSAPR